MFGMIEAWVRRNLPGAGDRTSCNGIGLVGDVPPRSLGVRVLQAQQLRRALLALGLALAPALARATEPHLVSLAVLPIKLLDTSGEPSDQTSRHAERLARLAERLSADLISTGLYQATLLPAESLARDCPSGEGSCLLTAARRHGGELVFVGVVHKSSTLILQFWARLVDAETGRVGLARDLNFRGDNDAAWQRAERFLMGEIRDAAPTR